MGTHANLLIKNKKDFISLHTRWDGFPEEIKDKLNNSIINYERGFDVAINNLEIDHPVLKEYFANLKQIVQKNNKTIQDWAKIAIISNLNHFHQVDEFSQEKEDTKSLKEFYGYYNPDLVFNLKQDGQYSIYNNNKSFDFTSFNMNQTYQCQDNEWILGIKEKPDDDFEHKILIKGLSQQEFNKKVIDIPLFYASMFEEFVNHTKCYLENNDLSEEAKEYFINGIRQMVPVFNQFDMYYKDAFSFFRLNELNEKDQEILMASLGFMSSVFDNETSNSTEEDKKKIRSMVIRFLPFEFHPDTVAEHLMLRMPNNVEILPNNYQLKTEVDHTMFLDNPRNPYFQLQDNQIKTNNDHNKKQSEQYINNVYINYIEQNYGDLCSNYQLGINENNLLVFDFNYNIIEAAQNTKNKDLNLKQSKKNY